MLISRREMLLMSASLATVGCRWLPPEAPTPISDSGLIAVNSGGLLWWSPYIGVHPNGGATEGYRKALTMLIAHGMLKGIRVDLVPYRDPIYQMFDSLGLEMVGIVPNLDLMSSSPEAAFDKYVSLYPSIRIFQIGNEITTIEGAASPTIERYMEAFHKIYQYAIVNYPYVTLVTQSTNGDGSAYASSELKRMVELGLTPDILSPQKVVVGINLYNQGSLAGYASVKNQFLGSYTFGVMETGANLPVNHIPHVNYFYPRIANELGVKRIYLFVLWGGDGLAQDAGFSLIQNPYNPANMTYDPIFRALTNMK